MVKSEFSVSKLGEPGGLDFRLVNPRYSRPNVSVPDILSSDRLPEVLDLPTPRW